MRMKIETERLTKALASPRLAIILLMGLSALSTAGTLLPTTWRKDVPNPLLEAARFFGLADPFHHPLFISLVCLLCLNIAFCTTRRFTLRRQGAESSPSPRRRLLPWLDGGVHLSILVILAGGVIKGTMGFVATQYFFIGVPANTAYEWRTEKEIVLDFAVMPLEKIEEYYPLQARVGVRDAASGDKVALLEIWEGREEEVPGGAARVKVLGLDREAGVIRLEAAEGGERADLEAEIREGGRTSFSFGRYTYTLVAYRQEIKTVRTRLVIMEGERVVKEEWIVPNGSVGYRGTNLYQTAWGGDEENNPFVGIQLSRDPGAPVFWTGAVAFAVLLPLFIIVRHRR